MPVDANGAMEKLKATFVASLPDKGAQITAALEGLVAEPGNAETLRQLYLTVNNLIGSGKMFQQTAVVTAAETLESRLRPTFDDAKPLDLPAVQQLTQRLAAALNATSCTLNTMDNHQNVTHLKESQLNSLKTLGEQTAQNILGDMITSFANRFPELCNELHDAFQKEDQKQLHFLAHRMKGTSGNIGASHLMSLCHNLERLSENGELSGQEELIASIKQEATQVITLLETNWRC